MRADDIENQPLIRAVTHATGRVMDARIEQHEERMHGRPSRLPAPRTEPLTAVPWPDTRIPDDVLAHVCEVCQEEGLTLEEAAARFGLPCMLLERELLTYARAHKLWALERALKARVGV